MRLRFALLLFFAACAKSSPQAGVKSATEVGVVHSSPLIVGRDGAESAVVLGHDVWVFGDTFMTVANVRGLKFVSNTFATSEGLVDGGLTLLDRLDDAGAPDELFAPTADEWAYDVAHQGYSDGGCAQTPCGGRYATWPGALVDNPDAGTALAFYGLIQAAPGSFNFEGLGQSVAVWSDFAALPTRPAPGPCAESPELLFCKGEPSFGDAAALVGGDVLAFGCTQNGYIYDCKLGKVAYADVATRSAWRFWTGSAWSSNLQDAAVVFHGAPIMGVFFDAYLKLWMAVYAEPLGNDVMFRTAPDLTGPWSDEGKLFVANHGSADGWTYDALPHPELSEADGKILYVTYSRPTGVFSLESALVRVELK